MRDYIRYVLRGREGLRSYLVLLATVLGSLFAVHMLLLGVLIADKFNDRIDLLIYEILGSAGAAIGYAMLTDRLLKIAVSSGVSRKAFLHGTAYLGPLFALITTAAITLFFLITDGIYHLSGNGLSNIGISLYYERSYLSVYAPRVVIFSLTALFSLILYLYSYGLLFVAFRNRFNNMPAGVIVTGIIFTLCHGLVLGTVAVLLLDKISLRLDPEWLAEQMQYGILLDDTFRSDVCVLAEAAVVWYLLVYGIFVLMMRRVPVRGKEKEGAI
ncbi:MAG: hypothetical protein IKQ91_02700 [Oscillospiraceae bacterium]|nr:hypothetical protein [Oscillospiraceae bacterium]